MAARDWFLFITTFIMAVLCGMYLYFTTFVPEYVANPVVQEIVAETAPTWTISVRAYGGCEMLDDCPAYELNSRRTARYQWQEAAEVETIEVPRSLVARYESVFEAYNLEWLSRPATNRTCRSYLDDIDYSIALTVADVPYTFDTCRTSIDYDHELVQLIRATFYYLEDPDSYVAPAVSNQYERRGLGGYIERVLDETFDYDDN